MSLPRVIPVLLLRKKGLIKTVQFKNHRYVGDPINAVKIFNEKEVDELIFLDIDASKEKRDPPYEYLKEVASECFMPLAYGGGVTSVPQIKKLVKAGVEKIIINTAFLTDFAFIKQVCEAFGSSTIVGAIDVKKNLFGKHQVYSHAGAKILISDPVEYAKLLSDHGVGEIFVNSVDLDGTMKGYDLSLIKKIVAAVDVPVVACGGAKNVEDIFEVLKAGRASAAAAGSMFVFYGKHNAVLITYPEYQLLKAFYNENEI